VVRRDYPGEQIAKGSFVMKTKLSQAGDTLGFWYLFGFGAGGLALNYSTVAVQAIAMPFYQMTLNINPVSLGIVLALPRLWDAFTDPLMGKISDNFHSRWGRRRPFVMIGAILMALAFGMIWMVPTNWSEGPQLAWLAITSITFFTCSTIFAVPLSCLYYEATPDYHERTRVMGFTTFWNRIGELTYQWMFPLSQIAFFASPVVGIRSVGWGIALFFLALPGLVSGYLGRERMAGIAEKQAPVRFWVTVRSAFMNRAFLYLIFIFMATMLTGYLAAVMDYYLLVYYICGGDLKEGSFWKGVISSGYAIVGFAGIPILGYCSKKIGKNRTFALVMVLVIVGSLSRWWIFRPGAGWWILLDPVLGGGFLWVAVMMLAGSIFADICDDDELRHGQRREGVFGAAYSWFMKLVVSVSFMIVGFVLGGLGFDASLGGDQAPETFFWMRFFHAFVPPISALFCIFFLWRFPITPEKAAETRRILEARRGAV
jgi:GPH family glycoside/pentoside/hexuronide:cation symporter